ncbi:MAG: hypothetical protein M1831_000869 [Alyxoria varia]|nr:MAG: hypothetical protein M1831_000869 [Alyxoria varia]
MASTTDAGEVRVKQTSKDQWSSQAYSNAASFVPQLTTKVLQYLDPQPTDSILDIGCGDGILTATLAGRCARIVGLDSSASFIETANANVATEHGNATFFKQDCRRIASDDWPSILKHEQFNKVFSNAALHWILRDVSTRKTFFSDILGLLKPDGAFVFEMGGAGNIAEVHTAIESVLNLRYQVPLQKIRLQSPWFFPSESWVKDVLEETGFEVEKLEIEYRPTRMTPKSADGSGGLEGWVRLMGSAFLDLIDETDRHAAVEGVCQVLEDAVTREEDGSQWLGYVRLRAIARKPRQ